VTDLSGEGSEIRLNRALFREVLCVTTSKA
jgi:hypothetical protein